VVVSTTELNKQVLGTSTSTTGPTVSLITFRYPFLALQRAMWHNTRSMSQSTLFSELKRRNVYKVVVAYAVIAWLLIQIAVTFLPLEAPAWLLTAFVVFLTLGFFLIVYISWAFEATPDGLKRTANVAPDTVLPSWSRRKFAVFIVTVAALAACLLVFDLVRAPSKPASPPPTAAP
jgi:hypothetical protein